MDQHPETAKTEASKCVHLAEAMMYLESACIRIFCAVISYLFGFSMNFRFCNIYCMFTSIIFKKS